MIYCINRSFECAGIFPQKTAQSYQMVRNHLLKKPGKFGFKMEAIPKNAGAFSSLIEVHASE
jgi:hypothetical protein